MGEYTYTSTQNRKYFNIVGQLLDVLTEMGQPAALGNASFQQYHCCKLQKKIIIQLLLQHKEETNIFTEVINIKST